ncbi:hypothetical protein [Desulforamulus aeronauticus]|uniref:Uncharacterized protein n=1 Tax=Desulforamulus aeronauticus DSM 10349 TaxID=1121421 RepID=A0A1M6XAZ3_9FIRM|nr:hypothetical protein [Desulforamulus aeronauticus]SHL03098.1 hypothetical protein SAMN02745123_03966 [Desulforamulus aeronauticus DSM 10349]
MNGAGMNLPLNQLTSSQEVKPIHPSILEETLAWLEDTDSPAVKAFGKGILILTGLYLIAQFVRALFL